MTGSGATSAGSYEPIEAATRASTLGIASGPGGGLDLVEEGPRRGVAVRIGLGIRGRRPGVEREGSVGMRLRLGGRVEGRLDIELRPDRRGHLAGQALADPAGLDERGRKPGVRDLVEGGERRLIEADGDLRTRRRRLSEAGDRGRHRLDEDELAPQRVRQAELGLDERERGRDGVERARPPFVVVGEGTHDEVGGPALERDGGLVRR